jgi:redox-sensing transcriptional repressor
MLAETLGVSITDAQVRKDLAALGSYGHPGIGYDADELITVLRRVLGVDRNWAVALVGVGNLAHALLRYQGFIERGFQVVALFDSAPAKIGREVEGVRVQPVEAIPQTIAATGAELGILTVPATAAQEVADKLIAAGIRGLLNFTPGLVRVPPTVSVVNVDLTVQLEQLAFLVQMTATG